MAMVTYRGVHGRRYVGVYKDTLPLGYMGAYITIRARTFQATGVEFFHSLIFFCM